MVCQKCGIALREGAKFCPGCGAKTVSQPAPVEKTALFQAMPATPSPEIPPPPAATVPPPPEIPPPPVATAPPPPKKRSIVKILAIVFVVLVVLGAGVVVAAFFGIRHFVKSSEPYKAAVSALEHSKAAKDSIGTVVDTGFPSASVSESGGTGTASFSMSVTGSKATGTYDSTLEKRNGQWIVLSGRIKLADGQTVQLDLNESALPPGATKSEGRQLASAAADSSSWTEQYWSQQLMRFRLPSDWIVKKMDQRELDCRKGEQYSSTYFAGNGYVHDEPLPSGNLLTVEVKVAAEKLHNGIIEGYAVRQIAGSTGLMEISGVGGKRVVTWKGYVQAGGKQREIDVSLATEYKDYDSLEPVFAAIFNSIHFD